MQRGLNRHIGRMRYNRIRISETLLQLIIKVVIVLLCVYIAARCINIISGEKAEKVVVEAVSDTSNVIAREIVDNTSIMTQYMLYLENHNSITEEAKKELLEAVVTDYIVHSEYTYDTTDPGYDQVINLIYENMNAASTQEETTTAAVAEKETKSVETAAKIIVPTPKVNGKVYTANNLGTFQNMLDKFYTVTTATTLNSSDLPIKKALKKKFKIKGSNKKPQILIYHTHSQEEFSNSTSDVSTTIIGVGDRLEKILTEQFGYNVIHDETEYDMVDGKLDRNEAYDQARVGVKKILEKNPSISLVLDIHRDGVNGDTRLVTEINEKSTAQVMFFNGMSRFKTTGDIDYLYNPYLFENLALSLQMKLKAEAYYPGFARRNYVNAYKYNLDLCKQCMLIEVGAQTNTYQEAKNAAEPLAMLINMVMGEE